MADQRLQRLLLLLLLLHCACYYDGQLQQAAGEATDLDDPNAYFWKSCSNDTFPASSSFTSPDPYDTNLGNLQANLTQMSSSRLFSLYATGTNGSAAIYGMYQCFGYLNLTQCTSCVAAASRKASGDCPQSISTRIELSGCSFLYQNTTILANFSVLGSYINTLETDDSTFLLARTAALQNVSSAAPATPTFYSSVAAYNGLVYAVAQCHGYLTSSECRECLSNAPVSSVYLGNQAGARVLLGSCMYRYESYRFFTEEDPSTAASAPISPSTAGPDPPPPTPTITSISTGDDKGANKKPLVIGVVVGSCLLLVVIFCIFIICRAKRNSPKNAYKGGADFIELQESLQRRQICMFTLQQMKTATKNFHEDNKLGQGGSGAVYKGTLQDGQVVAIKRLTRPSSQGKRQFLSEVKTITGVQHRSLIRLLGCCVDGSDRLLVYEYLEKRSLDKHIFDITDAEAAFSWNTRRKIIVGTAKGLAYLHHESHLRIVHRDIKAANILLDNNLDPKIADFGLARLFTFDQTHVSTQIAGTIGYLAPEYTTNGQLTEKSDTYSFGLVILEVLSGRRVIDDRLCPEQQGLLSWTWTLYEKGQQLELVDPFLVNKADYVEEEANRMVQVALLCTQSVPELRPAMSRVVMLLEGRDHDCQPLDVPARPALNTFNTSKLVMSSSSDLIISSASDSSGIARYSQRPASIDQMNPSTDEVISPR